MYELPDDDAIIVSRGLSKTAQAKLMKMQHDLDRFSKRLDARDTAIAKLETRLEEIAKATAFPRPKP